MFLGLPGRSHPLAPAAEATAAPGKETFEGREESTKVSPKTTVPTKPGAAVTMARWTQGAAAPVPREWVRLLLSACRDGGGGGGGGKSGGSKLAAAVDALTKIAMQSDEDEGDDEEEEEEGEAKEEEEEGQARAGVPVKEEEVRENVRVEHTQLWVLLI